MGNYIGYFKSIDDVAYEVRLIGDSATTAYTEVLLAGECPFLVSYQESTTPFDPIRKSNATIQIVNNDYMEDILSPYAQGTRVELCSVTGSTRKIEWVGFLTPKLYDQSYVNEYETIELEAADCISSLQYIDYEIQAESRAIVTIASIINQICNKCQLLDGYYWTRSKKVGNTILQPTSLAISEQNFFSDDTDEPWKLNEVLEEICKYLGVTCIQWGANMYFIDYQYLKNNEKLYQTSYRKSNNYVMGAATYLANPMTITKNNYRGSDNNISFEPIYNKVKVNCNLYNAEEMIPNIFDDKYLTNNINSGSFYTNYEVQPESPNCPSYPWGSSWFQQKYVDDANDAEYRYFHRTYNHKYWESVYYNPNGGGAATNPPESDKQCVNLVRNYVGGTIVDMGVVKKQYLDEYWNYVVPSKLDYKRYLCIAQHGWGSFWSCSETPVLRLKSGYKPLAHLASNSFLIINFNLIFEKYINRAYINPSWTTNTIKIGGSNSCWWQDGHMYFCLGIGGKWWNGSQWKTTRTYFGIGTERTNDNVGWVNEEKKVLNNVSWDMYVNETGYKIPLSDVDLNGNIEFIIYLPSIQYLYNNSGYWNGYAWIKDLSIKWVNSGQDIEKEEEDVVYENVIDADAINELDEIDLKITSYTDMTKPSFSHMLYAQEGTNYNFLTAIKEENLSGNSQKPEENIIERYVSQYNQPTKKIGLELDLTSTPFTKMYNVDVANPTAAYVQLGSEINYKSGTQRITLLEKR